MKRITSLLLIYFFIWTSGRAQTYPDNSLGSLKTITREGQVFSLETTNGLAKVYVLTPDVIRIRICKETFGPDFSYSVVGKMQPCKVTVDTSKEWIFVTTDSVVMLITRNPVRFGFLTKDARMINEDDLKLGTTWVGEQVTTYKLLQDGEHFIGLGEKPGNLDRFGEAHTNWNTDNFKYRVTDDNIYSSFPFYIGIHDSLAYGIYFDNTYKSYFNFGASNDRFSSFGAHAGEMDYYFIYGSNIPGIIENYTWLTGRIPMPPLWAIGFQQCRWSYFPDTEVLSTARSFRDKKIPLDVIYLDIHYMDGYKVFTWHPERFPDPAGMIKDLKDIGVRTTVIIDPGIKEEEGYKVFDDGLKNNVFLK